MEVISNTTLSEFMFVLRIKRPSSIKKIIPGQCFSLGLSDVGINREYSVFSVASNYIEFLIREVENGVLTPLLRKLKKGDHIDMLGPFGDFVINQNHLSKKFIFISTGSGIAPFYSFIKAFPSLDFNLYHGIRYENESMYAFFKNERYIPCFSKPLNGKPFYVTDAIKNLKLDKNTFVYLCGNRNMINDSLDILYKSKFTIENIFMEVFF